MASRRKKVIILAGSPDGSTLDWHEASLTSTFTAAVSTFLGEPPGLPAAMPSQASHPRPKWRDVAVPNAAEPVHDKQRTRGESACRASFLGHIADESPNQHLDFLEHSLAALHDLQPSQVEVSDRTGAKPTAMLATGSFSLTSTQDLSITTTSFTTSSSTSSLTSSSPPRPHQTISFASPITDLLRIPAAAHLKAIIPQTITLNLLVGVISIQPLRTLTLRRGPRPEMDLLELLVGDETRAGFGISFWLSPPTKTHPNPEPELRQELGRVRIGNVLLLRNVALSEFRGNVYGQSLSRRFSRHGTAVAVLDRTTTVAPAGLAAKVGRVRKWTGKFVGQTVVRKREASPGLAGGSGKRRRVEDLPPDSLE